MDTDSEGMAHYAADCGSDDNREEALREVEQALEGEHG